MIKIFKGFDCLHHKLMIMKPDAFGFHLKSTILIQQDLILIQKERGG